MSKEQTESMAKLFLYSSITFVSLSFLFALIIAIIAYIRSEEFVFTPELLQSIILSLIASFSMILLYLRFKTKLEVFYKEINIDKKMFEEFSFKGKTSKKIRMLNLTEKDLEEMRRELLTGGKEIYFNLSKAFESKLKDKWLNEKTLEYYDERINTLPKEALYDLYMTYRATKEPKDKERELFLFYSHVNLSYSLNGWFLKKLARVGYL